LAKPNYSFEKRQRELAKKRKQDAKDAKKREAREAATAQSAPEPVDEATPTDADPVPAPRIHLRSGQ